MIKNITGIPLDIISSFCLGHNPDWDKYIVRMTDRWKRHVCGWLLNGRNNPLHLVKFEKLQDDTLKEMSRVISFYGGTKMSNQGLSATISVGFNRFHRNHTDSFDHFTVAQETYVVTAIEEVIRILTGHYYEDSEIIEILRSYTTS